ncbi:hypothetical protein [Mycobacterium lacus]|uniref:Uncharacterized protein n=1 Tax=Mycobacterium lacus TaxID=169765 RepID=A0A1X1YNI0_9MYCO|nr:hypothetical protein [Mycobacterium lacus]MCV7124024.1 hypothetical protein [Mycobacterium lacus]ORW12585.1 hypothetical protein AWC15_15130 [Mycobacterium lacus]BBX98476.1 hypothetical protein MLAC_37700 [Mycobacterium lacus]
MTQPGEDHRAGNQPDGAAQERLRAALLISALSDWVPLAEVETAITHYHLSETRPTRQEFAVQTVRSLLDDGLMQIGNLPYPGEHFSAWDLPIDAAMERVYHLFVNHYDEPHLWEFTIWLALTPAGERLAHALRDRRRN